MFGAEVYLDPTEAARLVELLNEVDFEDCLALVTEDVFVEFLATDPGITVLPLSSRRLRVPQSADDVFAFELTAPIEVAGADTLDLRIAFLLVGRGGVVLSALISHQGEVDVDGILAAMQGQLDEVLGA